MTDPNKKSRAVFPIVWFDLEFTTIDLENASIMQAAVLITTADLEPIPAPGADRDDGLCFDVRIDEAQAETASEWVRTNQSEQLQRSLSDEDALPIEAVDQQFHDYLKAVAFVPSPQAAHHRNPLLAGNSIHNDYHLARRLMPKFAAALSYRLLDVSTFKELVRRWNPEYEFDKRYTVADYLPEGLSLEGEEHDALYDVKCSIAELAYYRQKLWNPAT